MTATIQTFTVIRSAPEGFESKAPYCVAIVKEGEIFSTVVIDGAKDLADLRVGLAVEAIDGRYVVVPLSLIHI